MSEHEAPVEKQKARDFSQASLERVEADTVQLSQSAAEYIRADEVEVRQGAALQVEAGEADLYQSMVALADTEELTLENSLLLAGRAGDARFENSTVGVLYTHQAVMDGSQANFMVAQNVQGGSVQAVVLLAGRVEGPVETIVDTPRALLAGLAAGAGAGLILLLGRYFRSSNR